MAWRPGEKLGGKDVRQMEFLELKLPPEEFGVVHSVVSTVHGNGFAKKYSDELKNYEKENPISIKYRESDSEETLKRKLCDHANEGHKDMRRALDQKMQEYILAQGGVIDSWPMPSSGKVAQLAMIPEEKVSFSYFGADYEITKDGKVARVSEEPVYRNEYRYRDTKAYTDMDAKRLLLEGKVQKGKEAAGSGLGQFFSFLGFLYCIYGFLVILGDIFSGVGQSLIALSGGTEVEENLFSFLQSGLWLALALPVYLYQFIWDTFGQMSTVLGVVLAAVLMAACLLGGYLCLKNILDDRRPRREWKKAKKELKALLESREYSQVKEENEALRKWNEEIAEQWHRAWFEWYCKVKERLTESELR